MEKQPARSGEPTQLGSYEIVRKLARGGMAELFLARAPIGSTPAPVEKLVVVKRILPKYAASSKFVQLFLDEARLAASLNHAHIVQVYDIGHVDSGGHFFTMEFLHGQDLRSILHRAWREGQRVPIHHAIQIAGHVASALHYAHEKRRVDGTLLDIVHRDVSPSNIIVSFDGAVKLVDFGVAKAATSTVKTRTGTLKGKIAYMSPEQAKGAPLDRRSDVFSLGIVLWEMVTTQRLFRGENDLATLQLIINQAPKRPSEVVPDCPAELERIIMKALSQDLATRYATAEELQRDLEALVQQLELPQSSQSLSTYVSGLFGDEVSSWEKAQAAGIALGDHLTSMHGNELTTPVSESDFVGLEDLEDLDDDDLDDDDEERTELAAELKPVVGMIDAVTTRDAAKDLARAAASDGVPAAAAKPGTGPVRRDPAGTPGPTKPPPAARRDPTGSGAKGTTPPAGKADPAMYVDSPERRRDPTSTGAPQRTVSPLAFIVPRGHESPDRPSSPAVSPIAPIARLAADSDPGLRIPPPAQSTPPPDDPQASGGLQAQRSTGATPSLPPAEPARSSTPSLSPWSTAQGSSPQTPAQSFPAAHNLMRDVPLLQDMAADRRAAASAHDQDFPPLQQVHRKALLIGAGLLVLGLIIAIATSGGGKTAAKVKDTDPPGDTVDPPRDTPPKKKAQADGEPEKARADGDPAKARADGDPAKARADGDPGRSPVVQPGAAPDAAPAAARGEPAEVPPDEVVMDPDPTGVAPSSGSAAKRRPPVPPKKQPDPKKRRFDPDAPLPP